jgi:hypothetical protein
LLSLAAVVERVRKTLFVIRQLRRTWRMDTQWAAGVAGRNDEQRGHEVRTGKPLDLPIASTARAFAGDTPRDSHQPSATRGKLTQAHVAVPSNYSCKSFAFASKM